MFDSGKYMQPSGGNPIEYRDTDKTNSNEGYNDRDNEVGNENIDEQMPESVSIHERPQWQQMQRSGRQPQLSQHQNVEYPPGSKQHLRTHSLENLSEPPVEKRYGRGSSESEANTASVQSPGSSFAAMSSLLESIDDEEEDRANVVDSVGEVPMTFASAMESSDASKWQEACDSEFQTLCKNKTWELVPLPSGRKAISSKWVFKVKETVDGLIERYKAHLVAKVFFANVRCGLRKDIRTGGQARIDTDHFKHRRAAQPRAAPDGRQGGVSQRPT
ncbi:unnamed protein product [Peronospora destructor]|uniref:Reverse transcriptase Ty1/copia-type domain-containing protein n=1 Tax=Peronospora destructor TaxID=86335 RepID=A0AAV0STV7_9STRA|nr:unnamed protein product [Peronospora destructor]